MSPPHARVSGALLWFLAGLLAMATVGAAPHPMPGNAAVPEADDSACTFGAVTDYRVQGERATAPGAAEPLDVVRIAGRCGLTPPVTP